MFTGIYSMLPEA